MSDADLKSAKTIREKLGIDVLKDLKVSGKADLVIRKRSLDNSEFDKEKGHLLLGNQTFKRSINDVSSVKAFAQTLNVGKSIVDALEEGVHPTIRRIYYNVKPSGLFKDIKRGKGKKGKGQSESDSIIKDIEVLTGMLREDMGILHTAKGLITGNITMEAVRRKGKEDIVKMVNLSEVPFPMMIPSCVDKIEIKDVKAKFVFVVEKDTEYNELVDVGLDEVLNCIMITGKGQPDRGTRRLVRRLNEEWGLPVVILTDLDPAGIQIYSVYKCGSISLSYESEKLACPNAKFMGMLPSDIEKFKIPEDDIVEAEEWDIKKANTLLGYEWLSELKNELELFLKQKKKAELESFSSHGYKFLQDVYIPEKLKDLGVG